MLCFEYVEEMNCKILFQKHESMSVACTRMTNIKCIFNKEL